MDRKVLSLALLSLACLAAASSGALAAGTWTNLGSDSNWTTPENWDTGVPAGGADVVFAQAGSLALLNSSTSVGTLTFNANGPFEIGTTNAKILTINTGVSVQAPGAYTYTISPAFAGNVAANVNDVGRLYFRGATSAAPNVTKTGAGLVEFNLYAGQGANATFGDVSIQEGTVLISNAIYNLFTQARSLTLAPSTTLGPSPVSNGGMLNVTGGGTNIIEGVVGDATRNFSLSYSGTGTLRFTGTYGRMLNGGLVINSGVVEIDNRVNNLDSRIYQCSPSGGILRLYGNDTVPMYQYFRYYFPSNVSGVPVVDVHHGLTASATVVLDSWDRGGQKADFYQITGEDIGDNTQPNWTKVDLAYQVGVTSFGVAPFVQIGTNMEFTAVSAARGAYVFSGTRVNLMSSTTAGSHYLLENDDFLDNNYTIATLKSTGSAGLDLNAYKLTLGVDGGGSGIIQTGVDNPTGIHGGTLAMPPTNCLFINNDTLFTLNSNITLGSSKSIVKAGTGKLKFAGLNTSGTIQMDWTGGDLEVDTPSNIVFTGMKIVGPYNLTKNGTGTMYCNGYQGTLAYSGTFTINNGVVVALGSTLGTTNPVVVNSGGTLYMVEGMGSGFSSGGVILNGGFLHIGNQSNLSYGKSTDVITVPAGMVGTIQNDLDKNLERLAGSGTLRKIGPQTATFDVATGLSTFTGDILVDGGAVATAAGNRFPPNMHSIVLSSAGTLWLSADMTVPRQTYVGVGTIMANANLNGSGAARTLTSQAGTFLPGGSDVGTLTLNGKLTFSYTGSSLCNLGIDIAAAGSDLLALTGPAGAGLITSLTNSNLTVNVADGLSLSGAVYTILTTNSDLSAAGVNNANRFRGVTFSSNIDLTTPPTVNYGLGFVSLSNLVYIPQNGTISGLKYRDVNGNHAYDAGEPVLSGWSIYLDMNDNGTYDAGDQLAVTGTDGRYSFTELAGSYTVREQLLPGSWTQTAPWPSLAHSINLTAGATIDTADFGNAIKGDANGDGLVDQQDYTVWYSHYGITTGTWNTGDMNFDNLVDQQDYTLWYSNYGASAGAGVPEPVTMVLLALGGVALLRRRK